MKNKKIFFVMGVSGCGKSTIGMLLAKELHIPFFDGDNYHPEANVRKMRSGNPLSDKDRHGWLKNLNKLAIKHQNKGTVIACSALKESYREILKGGITESVEFIYLEGSFELIKERLQNRSGHYMPLSLLRSQFEALEPPKKCIRVSIEDKLEDIVSNIIRRITSDSL